jgi:putative oxidoreductase
MDILFFIGRIIFGGFFIYNGISHFNHLGPMSQYTKMKGVPLPSVAVALAGLLLLLGGLSILLGILPVLGIAFLLAFLIPTSLMMHRFWAIQDPQMKMVEKVNFLKNIALTGALLIFLAIQSPWPFSITL